MAIISFTFRFFYVPTQYNHTVGIWPVHDNSTFWINVFILFMSPLPFFFLGETYCFCPDLMYAFPLFSSPGQRPRELLPSLGVCRPSYVVNFNLLLRNHWANFSQTLVEWYLYGPLPKLCPLIQTSNQDGHQAKNRKKGGWNFNCPLLL